jgi:hypothetical protein
LLFRPGFQCTCERIQGAEPTGLPPQSAHWCRPSHSLNFDQRRRHETLRTAMATAFFWPTSTTSFLPRVTRYRAISRQHGVVLRHDRDDHGRIFRALAFVVGRGVGRPCDADGPAFAYDSSDCWVHSSGTSLRPRRHRSATAASNQSFFKSAWSMTMIWSWGDSSAAAFEIKRKS